MDPNLRAGVLDAINSGGQRFNVSQAAGKYEGPGNTGMMLGREQPEVQVAASGFGR